MKKINALCSVLFLSLHVYSTTYYVSNTGNDGNNGLAAGSAFKTLQHASDVVKAGDSVSVFGGVYKGFYQTTSGTALQRILFTAEPGVIVNQPNDITDDGINLEGASFITIEGFTVYGQPRTGIRVVDDTGVIIRNNICDSCGVWGILTGFSENILIESNTCTRTIEQHGIYFGNSADNPVIRNNICWGNHDCGIHMNGDASLGGDGIISNALVENNIIYGNGYGGGSAINCDGVQNSFIQNNLLYDNHASGIALFRIDGGGGASNNRVINNTVLQASDARWAMLITGGSTGNIIFNNIFYSDHPFRGSISIDDASKSGFHSNYNVLVDRMSTDDGNTVITLAQWQDATYSDSSSFTSTPDLLFLDASSNNYHVFPGSPAFNTGTESYYSIPVPEKDFEDDPRLYDGFVDIGCDEAIYEGIQNISSHLDWYSLADDTKLLAFDLSGKKVFQGDKTSFLHFCLSRSTQLYLVEAILDNGKKYFGKWLM